MKKNKRDREGKRDKIHENTNYIALLMTPHALIRLSVYPANSVCPSALQANETHSGSRLFLPTAMNSGLSSSTLLFFSRSKMMMDEAVAAQSQYLFGEKTRAWISLPALRL